VEAVDQAANFFVGGSGGAPILEAAGIRFQVATGAESVEQECGEALEIGRRGGNVFLRLRNGLGIASEFVEADGHGLTEVHGAVLFESGDAQEPMAVAEVFIRKTALLRSEKEGNAAAGKTLAEETRRLIEAANGVLQLSEAHGSGSDDQRAIRYGVRNSLELLGIGEQRRSANGGTRLAKSQFVGIDNAQVKKTEVAHGAGCGADVEGIAGGDKHDPQAVGFGVG
jgi:hypothetical protein